MLKNKKGEITSQQIVILIILIMSFAVILFFLFRLNLGEETQDELCRNSVITRGSSVIPTDAVPLNCKRDYVCITEDGSCEDLVNPTLKKVKTKNEVYDVLANEMADCWWMFGEGKTNYIGNDFVSDLYCSICSQIAFDDSVKDIDGFEFGKINEKELYIYLESNEVSGGVSYLDYLGLGSVSDIESAISNEGGNFGEIEFDKPYFVITGIFSEVGVYRWVAGGVVAGGLIAAPFTGGLSLTSIAIIGGAAIGGGFVGDFVGTAVKGDGVENEFLSSTLIEADSEKFKALNCYDITTIA